MTLLLQLWKYELPTIGRRAVIVVVSWLVAAFIYAVAAPIMAENRDEDEARALSFIQAPLIVPLGLSWQSSYEPNPDEALFYWWALVLFVTLLGTFAFSSPKLWTTFAIVHVSLVVAGFLGASRMLEWWNKHGHG